MGNRIRYIVEPAAVGLFWGLCGLLGIDAASRLGAWLGRTAGPSLPVSRVARANLVRALPELEPGEVEDVIRRMWENLGRNLAEYPHIGRFYSAGRVELRGEEHLHRLRDDGIGGILFSAHYGNWELLSVTLARFGVPPVLVYRRAKYPGSERLIQRIRIKAHFPDGAEYVAKDQGLRPLLAALRAGKHVGMLVDQKLTQGIPVPFFGRDAMTATTLATLAMKVQVPVIPAKIERLDGARFRITCFPPVMFERRADLDGDLAAAMRQVNGLIEDWIRDRPDQWLWIHKRWPEPG